MDSLDSIQRAIRQQSAENDVSMKYLTFRVSGQVYGVSIDNVIEIVKVQPVTELPNLPYYAKGIIDLRGKLVPLIDVNLRFGKPEQEYTDRTCVVIVDIDGLNVGFIVDEVEDVLDIDNGLVSSPPSLSADDSARYVTGIAKVNKYLVLILDARLLFSDNDRGIFSPAV